MKDPILAKVDNHHKTLLKNVNQDCYDHIAYRRPAVKFAEEAIQGYQALNTASKPGRSSFFPPVLHSIIYSRMALEAANMPDVQYKNRNASSEPLMKFINAAKENAEAGDGNMRPPAIFNWYLQNFDKLMFGVGFRHLTYLLQSRVINIKDENGKWREKFCIEYDDIWDEKLHFFYTGVSRDTLPGMFGGTSAHTDKFFRREQFKAHFGSNEHYFNIELAMEKCKGEFIRVRYYWNLPLDLFFVQALDAEEDMIDDVGNGVPIREDYILEYGPPDRPQKMIPITSIHGDFNFDMKVASYLDLTLMTNQGRAFTDFVSPSRNQSFWTKGNAQLVKGVIAAKRALWRARLDNNKSATVFFALSQNPGVLNQIKRSDLYGVVPIKADERSFNVKALIDRAQAENGMQEFDDALDNLAAFAIGHDWKSVAGQLTNETATVAAIRENVKNVRAAQNQGMNEAGGITRHYKLLLNLIQQFYPEKTKVSLLGGDKAPKGTKEKDLIRKDSDGSVIAYMHQKQIPYKESVVVKRTGKGKYSVRADDKEGSKMLPTYKELLVTPEEPEIYIVPNSSFAKMKALERSMQLEKLQGYQAYLGIAYPDDNGIPQPLIPKTGAQYLLKKAAEAYEDDPDEIVGQTDAQPQKPKPQPFGKSLTQRSQPQGQIPGQTPMPGQMPGQPPAPSQSPMQMMPGGQTPPKPQVGMGGNTLAGMLKPGL